MGAGNQGGGGNAEDAAIRRDATARGEDPSVTRQYFAETGILESLRREAI
jgi:hypothetical protein